MSELSHINSEGKANMVDVAGKPDQTRIAKATGFIKLHTETIKLINENLIKKGDVITIAEIAGIQVEKKHIPGPQGVRGRNSDNSRLRTVLDWEPEISLEEGLTRTYNWIEKQVESKLSAEGEITLDDLSHSKVITS